MINHLQNIKIIKQSLIYYYTTIIGPGLESSFLMCAGVSRTERAPWWRSPAAVGRGNRARRVVSFAEDTLTFGGDGWRKSRRRSISQHRIEVSCHTAACLPRDAHIRFFTAWPLRHLTAARDLQVPILQVLRTWMLLAGWRCARDLSLLRSQHLLGTIAGKQSNSIRRVTMPICAYQFMKM